MKGKFLTTAILASLLVGSNAMASIARQAVMGGQPTFTSTATTSAVNGALWYDDDYNVFYNPAYINDNKNYITVNKGFEGGFFKSEFENFAYGVYLNRGGLNTATSGAGVNYAGNLVGPGFTNRAALTGTATVLSTQRPLDLFFGGDTGLKWGAHVAWAYNRTQLAGSQPNNGDAEITNRYWHFDFGAEVMGFEPYIGTTMFSKYQNNVTTSVTAAELNEFNAGFRYKYEGWTPYFAFKKYRENGTPVGAANQLQTRHNIFGLGVAHDTKVADGVHVLKNVGIWQNSVEDDAGAAGAATAGGQATPDINKDYKDTVLPINIAIEAEATSWLTLRAGATMDLINQRKHTSSNRTTGANPAALGDKNVSQAGTARFRVGSTLKFGKLHLDSAFGSGGVVTPGAESLDTSSLGVDSQTFAFLSASYHW